MSIEKLTQAQIDRMVEYRDKWIAIGLSTVPADRPMAERGVGLAYSAAGLPAPRVVWCGSPFGNAVTRAIVCKVLKNGDSVRASVCDNVWDSVEASVMASVGASVWDNVWDSVMHSVRASVWDNVGDSVCDSVEASVMASVCDSVRDSGYGQHDAGWLAFNEYFHDVCGLTEQTKKLAGLWLIARAGWFLPHANICWISERHNVLERDDRGRLHCDSGPALTYPDGWSIYSWHGVRVRPAVIENREKTTVADILAEKNTEVRRAMRNLYGNDRFMRDAGAQEIGVSKNHGARLLALRLDGDPVDIRMVELTCPSTGSKYLERVPPDCADVLQALSWRFRVKPSEYKPKWET